MELVCTRYSIQIEFWKVLAYMYGLRYPIVARQLCHLMGLASSLRLVSEDKGVECFSEGHVTYFP